MRKHLRMGEVPLSILNRVTGWSLLGLLVLAQSACSRATPMVLEACYLPIAGPLLLMELRFICGCAAGRRLQPKQ